MKALLLVAAAPLALATPALAQHAGHQGHVAPSEANPSQAAPAADAPKATDPHAGHDMPAPTPDAHAGHDMSAMPVETPTAGPHAGHAMPGNDMPGHDMPGHDMSAMQSGPQSEAGTAPAPAAPTDRWADRYYPPAEMDAARAIARKEHGDGKFGMIMFNLAEYQVREGRDGYRWDGEGWFGGDIDRLTIKTEGEGSFGEPIEAAEMQALWSHALDAYWNLQSGVRVDVQPGPAKAYATVGVEGLAPYWFEVEGALFLSDKGDLLGRVEAYYDQRLTQRLMLQPRVELNFAAQDVVENRMGSGLVNAELGLRLRYEIAREFAPYVGVSWDRKVGDTARYARADGERRSETGFVAGVRIWF